MSNFWPNREAPKGFSIETLAKKYRQRLNKSKNSSLEININSPFMNSNPKDYTFLRSKESSIHWANRDFRDDYNVA